MDDIQDNMYDMEDINEAMSRSYDIGDAVDETELEGGIAFCVGLLGFIRSLLFLFFGWFLILYLVLLISVFLCTSLKGGLICFILALCSRPWHCVHLLTTRVLSRACCARR